MTHPLTAGTGGGNRGAAAPGELFVLPHTAQYPVEWLVIASAAGTGGTLLVVPADTNPATGAVDLRLPPRAPAGPLSLRCGFHLELQHELLREGERTGSLDDRDLKRVAAHVAALASGSAQPDPLGSETESDPDYRDWITGTVAPAAHALQLASAQRRRLPVQAAARETGRRRLTAPWLAAAALLLVSLGLSWTVVIEKRRVRALSQPEFDLPSAQLLLDGPRRGFGESSMHVRVPAAARQILLTIDLGAGLPAGAAGHLEILTVDRRPLWRSPRFLIRTGTEMSIVVPRSLLSVSPVLVALLRDDTSPATTVDVHRLDLDPAP